MIDYETIYNAAVDEVWTTTYGPDHVAVELAYKAGLAAVVAAAKAEALMDAAHAWDEVPDRTPRTGTDTGPWLVARAVSIASDPELKYCLACGCSTPLGAHFSHCPSVASGEATQ